VEEIAVARAGLEIEKRLCNCVMHVASHGACSLTEVVRLVLCAVGDIRGGAKVRLAGMQVGPGGADVTAKEAKGRRLGVADS
jgi:hypothetical protein